MYGNGKLIFGILIGVIAAIAIFCIAVGIGCAANGLTFGEQIVEWFGTTASTGEEVEEVVDEVTEALKLIVR